MSAAHERFIDKLLQETESAGGLAPVDLARFWRDDAIAAKDPFGRDIPQPPLGWFMWPDNVWDELGLPEDNWRYLHDDAFRVGIAHAYNELSQRIVGRKFLDERPFDPARAYPRTRPLHEIFEAREAWHAGSWWIGQVANTPDELARLLDRVDQRLADLRGFVLPAGWDDAGRRLMSQGIRPPRYVSQRGPVTFATSIYGCENLIFLILDQPDLAARFRDTILRAMLGLRQLMEQEAGFTAEDRPRGFGFNDDNCYLLTADLYEQFGYPVLKGMFEYCSPGPRDHRYQHSDSAMDHLLPILARLNLSACNFGPTLSISQIRAAMPRTIIRGQIHPMTLCRNESRELVRQVLRDFDQARESRGLVCQPAGVVNNGTRLSSLRLIMSAIQRYARYT